VVITVAFCAVVLIQAITLVTHRPFDEIDGFIRVIVQWLG
jgi:hypothetical protein